MVSRNDVFEDSGPVYLTTVNWNDPHYQRSVVASLVRGAYCLEHDRRKKREGSEALAPAWWESFHFKLSEKFFDYYGSSIFGAIYEFKPPDSVLDLSAMNAPKFVIAFRGTILKGKSFLRDIELDIRLSINKHEKTSCSRIATEAVANLVSAHGNQNIWLAGHSMGASMAMLVGKSMAKKGINLKAFLFNPPFISAPLDVIKNDKVKKGFRITTSFMKAGAAVAVKLCQNKSSDSFSMLSSWVPDLFVNPADHISKEYIEYFKLRATMEEVGAGIIEREATQISFRDLLLNDSEPLHLLPSANLTENLSSSDSNQAHGILHEFQQFMKAHGIDQWWKQDLNLQLSNHHFK